MVRRAQAVLAMVAILAHSTHAQTPEEAAPGLRPWREVRDANARAVYAIPPPGTERIVQVSVRGGPGPPRSKASLSANDSAVAPANSSP